MEASGRGKVFARPLPRPPLLLMMMVMASSDSFAASKESPEEGIASPAEGGGGDGAPCCVHQNAGWKGEGRGTGEKKLSEQPRCWATKVQHGMGGGKAISALAVSVHDKDYEQTLLHKLPGVRTGQSCPDLCEQRAQECSRLVLNALAEDGCCVVSRTHSQGGGIGWNAALYI